MARPRQFDEDDVRKALMNVFWEKGYEATSMQDLVDATGLLKGSLYGAFGDKQALYQIALQHYDQSYIQAGVDMLGQAGSCHEKIGKLFDSVSESMKTGVFAGGCLLCNASVEMAPVDPTIRRIVQNQINRLITAVSKAIQTDSNPESTKNADTLAGVIVSVYLGTRVIAKAGMPVQMVIDAKNQCLTLLP